MQYVGRTAIAALTTAVAGQILHAAYRNLPSFEGSDPSGTFGDPDLPPLELLVLGDSTATAPGVDDDETWPRLVARHLATEHHVELTCIAEGGSRSWHVLHQQVPQTLDRRWDIAIVSVGSNDVLRLVPIWRFARHMDQIVASLTERCSAVVLFGVGDLGSIPRLRFPADRMASTAGHIADWVHRRTTARHETFKIDQWRLTTAAFNSGNHMFAPDLFHPSPVGHRAWADALIPTIDEAVVHLHTRMEDAR